MGLYDSYRVRLGQATATSGQAGLNCEVLKRGTPLNGESNGQGGMLMEENISHSVGSKESQYFHLGNIINLIEKHGRKAVQRSTTYD